MGMAHSPMGKCKDESQDSLTTVGDSQAAAHFPYMELASVVYQRTDRIPREKPSVDEQLPSFNQRVETMMSVMDQLIDTLTCLSEEELQHFKEKFMRHLPVESYNTQRFFRISDCQDSVFLMMVTCSRHTVEKTMEVLKEIKRTDLVQRLSDSSSAFKEEHSDEHRSALIHKVATMAAVKQLLLETLRDLRDTELTTFTQFLDSTASEKNLPTIPSRFHRPTYRAAIVDRMVNSFGRQSVELTREVLEEMNKTDLMQRLPESSSGPGEKPSEEEPPTTVMETTGKAADEMILVKTLRCLPYEELEKFKWLLQFTYFQKNLPHRDLELMNHRTDEHEVVNLMMESPQSLEVTKEVLMDMNRPDLVLMLSGSSSGHEGKRLSNLLQDPAMKSTQKKLLETLEDLSFSELDKFKHVLLHTKLKDGLPKMPRHRMETADRTETVELMVEIYGMQCVEVTRAALEKINRTDLVEKLSDSCSGIREPLRRLEPQDCGQVMDSSVWIMCEPAAVQVSSSGDEFETYRLQSDAGKYFTSGASSLRWVCKGKVSFTYQFCSWEEHMERMESLNYMPAGPLIDIKVTDGQLDEVYLPHWICTDPEILKEFAVLHIDDCGDVIEKVSEVTPSHVKLSEPVFSPRATLMKLGLPVRINCDVLIYYEPNTPHLKLHVYLIPCDPALKQTVEIKKKSRGYEVIEKSRPNQYLKMQQDFSLSDDIKAAQICPEVITLRYDSQDPNFYEVFIEKPDRDFQLTLSQKLKRKATVEEVWTCTIRNDDYRNPTSQVEATAAPSSAPGSSGATRPSAGAAGGDTRTDDEHFVDKHKIQLTQRVSHTEPILDELLDEGVLQEDSYDAIRKISTSQDRMRALYSGCLKAGAGAKDIFYKILEKNEKFLIEDLKKNN